jgi:hypothetical protein
LAKVWLSRDLWHLHFYGETLLKLVAGRERIYLGHFWNDLAAERTKSVSERDRPICEGAYAQPGAMQAGFDVFRNFEQDAKDFAVFGQTKPSMPMLVLSEKRPAGNFSSIKAAWSTAMWRASWYRAQVIG